MFPSTIPTSDQQKELCKVELEIQQYYNGDGSTLLDCAVKETSENQCSDEVSLVLEKIHKQEWLKQELTCHLREVQAAKECAVIVQAWQRKKGLKVVKVTDMSFITCQQLLSEFLSSVKSKVCQLGITPLYAWYVQLSQAVLDSGAEDGVNPRQKRHILSVSDRLCYNLRYKNAFQQATNRNNQDMLTYQKLENQWLETLSFCTRRKGICVNIVLGKRNKEVDDLAQEALDDSDYTILLDPHIQGLENDLKDNLLQRQDPCVLFTDLVWPAIESCGF